MTVTTSPRSIAEAIEVYQLAVKGADDLTDGDLADAAVLVQDTIAQLRIIEADLCAALGKRTGSTTGNVSDGRQFTLKRSPDRTSWLAEEWKRDVRRVVTTRITERFAALDDTDVLIDRETSEVTTLGRVIQIALTELQEVHGSAPPKSSVLKKLGLYATDYCSSSPGGWRLSAIRPNETAAGS